MLDKLLCPGLHDTLEFAPDNVHVSFQGRLQLVSALISDILCKLLSLSRLKEGHLSGILLDSDRAEVHLQNRA